MEYVGTELELFAAALKWKDYLAAQIQPFVTGRVLEVGAGIGSNITLFHNDRVAAWLASPYLGRGGAGPMTDE